MSIYIKTPKTLLFIAITLTIGMIIYAQFVLGYFSKEFYADQGPNSLGLSFGYSNMEVTKFFSVRSEVQLRSYIEFLKIWDSIFAIIYTAMYITWILILVRKMTLLIIVPLAHMFTDWIENFLEILLVNEYLSTNQVTEDLVKMGSAITITKWSLSLIIYLIIIYLATRRITHFIKQREQ